MSLAPTLAVSIRGFLASPPVAPRSMASSMLSGARLGSPLRNGFGPATLIGRSAPPSVFTIYNAQGYTASTLGPNPILSPTIGTMTDGVPHSVLYARLGNTVQQIQLSERNSRVV